MPRKEDEIELAETLVAVKFQLEDLNNKTTAIGSDFKEYRQEIHDLRIMAEKTSSSVSILWKGAFITLGAVSSIIVYVVTKL